LIWIRAFRLKKRYLLLLVMVVSLGIAGYRVAAGYFLEREVAAMSWAIADRLIVIDPGHGGKDSGARSPSGVWEKEVTLSVALKLAEVLRQAGADVLMTREEDVFLCDPDTEGWPAQHREDLSKRIGMANKKGADLYISIHVNSFISDAGQSGAQTFYKIGCEESAALGNAIQSELIRILKNTRREAKSGDYFILNNAEMPAVIVEIGFITNPEEARLMQDPSYQNKLAWAIYAGVVKYYADKLEFSEKAGKSGGASDNGSGDNSRNKRQSNLEDKDSKEVWWPLYQKGQQGGVTLNP